MTSITTGPKKNHGATWHKELEDKGAAIRIATYYVMKKCQGSAQKLSEGLDNISEHYKGNHSNCANKSRCRLEEMYECSKRTLKDPNSKELFSKAIKRL